MTTSRLSVEPNFTAIEVRPATLVAISQVNGGLFPEIGDAPQYFVRLLGDYEYHCYMVREDFEDLFEFVGDEPRYELGEIREKSDRNRWKSWSTV